MHLSELRALVKVAECGSFTQAAQMLGTQKTYLSRQISQLERRLGLQLLARSTRSLSLTEAGREILARAVGILDAVDEVEQVAAQIVSEPRGRLKLSCGVEFGMMAVNRWINDYLRLYPEVSVEADFSGRLVDLVHEGFDLAIRVGELADSNLVARKLGELEYALFAAPEYLNRNPALLEPADLAQHTLLAFHAGNQRASWTLLQQDRREQVGLTGRLQVNNSFAVRDAAVAGLGIALLPRRVAALTHGHALVAVLPDWHAPNVPVHAVFPSNRYLTPKVRAFIDHATASFHSLKCYLSENPAYFTHGSGALKMLHWSTGVRLF